MAGRNDWATTAYRSRLGDEEDFLRVRLQVERGRVSRFTVQYETVINGQTYPVVRYDSAHGEAHRDTIDSGGNVIAKDWFIDRAYAEIATEAIDDIKTNWRAYRDRFERRVP